MSKGRKNDRKFAEYQAKKTLQAKKKVKVGDGLDTMMSEMFEGAFSMVDGQRNPLDNPLKELIEPCKVFLEDPENLSQEVLDFSRNIVLLDDLWERMADEEKKTFNDLITKKAKDESKKMVDGMRDLVQNVVRSIK